MFSGFFSSSFFDGASIKREQINRSSPVARIYFSVCVFFLTFTFINLIHVVNWHFSLKIIDVGNNLLCNLTLVVFFVVIFLCDSLVLIFFVISSVLSPLSNLPFLKFLMLKGNKVCEIEKYQEQVCFLLYIYHLLIIFSGCWNYFRARSSWWEAFSRSKIRQKN